jgi:signal transduction histidine kinase
MANKTQQAEQAKLPTETLLRLSVLVFWLMIGVQIFTPLLVEESGVIAKPSNFEIALSAIQFLGFGLAFWLNTRNIAFQSTKWLPILLLGYQALCGFTLHTDLLYIVAAEIPLVLPGRTAVIWIVIQTWLLAILVYSLDSVGTPLDLMILPQKLPHWLVLLLTDIAVFAVHAFAFFMGYLAASEARGRRLAERVNAELLATQDLLAQSIRMAERNFVARELHDVLGHHLVALKLNLELAQHLVQDVAKTPINDALKLVSELLGDVRSVVGKVRGQPNIDLRQALQTLLSGVTELRIDLEFPSELEISDPNHAHTLFRCIQEAITNTIKHAQAQHLWLKLSRDSDSIRLVMCDDGKGVVQLIPGQGLNGMRERLELVGGSLDITNSPGQSFTLTVRIAVSELL